MPTSHTLPAPADKTTNPQPGASPYYPSPALLARYRRAVAEQLALRAAR